MEFSHCFSILWDGDEWGECFLFIGLNTLIPLALLATLCIVNAVKKTSLRSRLSEHFGSYVKKKPVVIDHQIPWENFECSQPWVLVYKIAHLLALIMFTVILGLTISEQPSIPWYRLVQASSDVCIWIGLTLWVVILNGPIYYVSALSKTFYLVFIVTRISMVRLILVKFSKHQHKDAYVFLQIVSIFFASSIWCMGFPINRRYKEIIHVWLGKQVELFGPEETASLLSSFFYNWVTPIISHGYYIPLETTDIPPLSRDDRGSTAFLNFADCSASSYSKKLLYATKEEFMKQNVAGFVQVLATTSSPLILKMFLNNIHQNPGPTYLSILYAFAIFFSTIVASMSKNQMYFHGRKVGMRIRAILIQDIFNKSLKRPMSYQEGDDTSIGKTCNLVAVDTEKIMSFMCYSNRLWSCPFQVLICIYALYAILGLSGIVGTVAMLLWTFVAPFTMKRLRKWQSSYIKQTDKRMALIQEVFGAIRQVKFFVWEELFLNKIGEIRRKELSALSKTFSSKVLINIIFAFAPSLVSLISFTTYTYLLHKTLDAATAFAAIGLFKSFDQSLSMYPSIINDYISASISIQRISSYLDKEDINDYRIEGRYFSSDYYYKIGLEDVTVSIGNQEILKNINVEIPLGKISLITGPVGCGKTSLLLTLLGELKIEQGKVFFPDRCAGDASSVLSFLRQSEQFLYQTRVLGSKVAFACQQPWIFNGTIRENILFGRPYEPKHYKRMLYICGLRPDVDSMEGGDLTEIGEKGVTLSGGQKQRISLARALYSQADVILLDDPFSAVDSTTANHIIYHVFSRRLLKGKTVIIVTHHITQCLPFVEHVILMNNNSQIIHQGDPFSLSMLPSPIDEVSLRMETDPLDEETKYEQSNIFVSFMPETLQQLSSLKDHAEDNSDSEGSFFERESIHLLIKEEQHRVGDMNKAVYLDYFQKIGKYKSILAIAMIIATKGLMVLKDVWVSEWTNSYDTISVPQVEVTLYYTIGYLFVNIFIIMALFCSTFLVYYSSVIASKAFHDEMLLKVIFSPIDFFNTTPMGRIANRFSSDINCIDLSVADALRQFLDMFLTQAMIIVIIIAVCPPLLLILVPAGIVYRMIARRYLHSSRELKRLEAIARSPLYSILGETLSGLSTIRSYNSEERYRTTTINRIDAFHQPFYYYWASNRWLSIRVELLGCVVLLCTSLAIVMDSHIDAGMAGLAISYALNFMDVVTMFVRVYSNVEIYMNSVERVQEYQDLISEAPYVIDSNFPKSTWPHRGFIEVKNLTVGYNQGFPPVLKDVTFTIFPGEKIGVVGATGAGKSTLALSFFRFLESSSGSIFIDGVEISTLGLKKLRESLTIIPQDPILFNGTIRENLDPNEEHSDEALRTVLGQFHLMPLGVGDIFCIRNISLETVVNDNGNNFSVGERALICLARAFLKPSRVIFIDEATASIDPMTDQLIQQTLRESFQDCTVICIAHRLRTVMDFDRILVLHQGSVVEFDTPFNLLGLGNVSSEEGYFRSFCKHSGEYELLCNIAKGTNDKKYNKEPTILGLNE